MSFSVLRSLLISSLLAILTACSAPQQNLYHSAPLLLGSTNQWESQLAIGPGRLVVEFELQPGTSVDILLTQYNDDNTFLAKINLNDYNCSAGHEAFIKYTNNSREHYTNYFEKELLWNTTSTLIINWNDNQNFTTTINGETLSTSTTRKIKHIKIVSYNHPMNIKNLQYTQY